MVIGCFAFSRICRPAPRLALPSRSPKSSRSLLIPFSGPSLPRSALSLSYLISLAIVGERLAAQLPPLPARYPPGPWPGRSLIHVCDPRMCTAAQLTAPLPPGSRISYKISLQVCMHITSIMYPLSEMLLPKVQLLKPLNHLCTQILAINVPLCSAYLSV